MLEELKKHFTSIQILITLLIIAIGIYLFQVLSQILGNFSDIIIMLIFAWLLNFILEPFVNTLTRAKINKVVAAGIVYAIFLGLVGIIIFLFIPALSTQLQSMGKILPKYLATYPDFVNKASDAITGSLGTSLLIIPSIANFFFYVLLAIIISFYFVIDKERINEALFTIMPKQWHKDARFTQHVIDTVFASFLRVQLFLGLILGIVTAIVLQIFTIPFVASTAVIAGLLTMIPLLGPVLGIIPPVLVAFITDPARALFIFIILLAIQQVVFNIIGPKLLGNAFKIHPVIVLLSFLVGIKLAGGAGAIFAVPVLGILIVVIHRISSHFINPTSEK